MDDQLLKSLSETKHETEGDVTCYNGMEKKYSYELEGRLLRARSVIHDSTNRYNSWDANYDDYFYYTHEGVVAERHDDTGGQKIFTRWGRELIGCTQGTETYFYIQNIRGDVVMPIDTATGEATAIRDYDATSPLGRERPG